MPTILKTKNSVTTTVVPTTLQQGELAVNITDKKVWVGNAATTPVQLLGGGADGNFSTITVTGNSYLATTSGNVGIGTTSPSYKLDVNGSANFAQNVNLASGVDLQWGGGDVAIENSSTNLIFKTFSGSLAERMRIDSAGNVGIGNSIPSTFNSFANNLVIGNGSSDEGLTIYTGTTNVGTLNFADGTSGDALYQGYIQYNHNLDEMRFYVNYAGSTSPRLSINSVGGVQAANSISVGGATPTTSGAGITFPATQDPSSNANTLDDYEEGTWTPTDVSGAGLTFSSVQAYYTKVGRMVTLNASFTFPANASTAAISIGGIPFSYGFSNAETCFAIFDYAGLGANQVYFATTGFDIRPAGSGTVRLNVSFSTVRVQMMVSYSTSA